jgi:hypothetical protein
MFRMHRPQWVHLSPRASQCVCGEGHQPTAQSGGDDLAVAGACNCNADVSQRKSRGARSRLPSCDRGRVRSGSIAVERRLGGSEDGSGWGKGRAHAPGLARARVDERRSRDLLGAAPPAQLRRQLEAQRGGARASSLGPCCCCELVAASGACCRRPGALGLCRLRRGVDGHPSLLL